MRIVSLNAWGGAVWPALSAWIGQIRADVLCLQEVTRRIAPSDDWLIYGDAYRKLDQRADLFGDVSTRLPDHIGRFAAAARGDLRDSTGRVVRSEHGIAMWVRRDLVRSESLERFVIGQFRGDGWGPEPVPRALQVARIEGRGSGSLLLAHLHGLRDPTGKGDTPDRLVQAENLRDHLAVLRRPGDRVVVAGDLNLLPDSATFSVLAKADLHDLVTASGHVDTRTSLYAKPIRHANYCLVSPQVDVAGFDVPAAPEVSDHRPMILDINL